MLRTVDEMVSALRQHPEVVGIVRFGSDYRADAYAVGDCDLFVILDHTDPTVTSLHFYADDVPVDLNLITLDEMRCLDAKDGFRWFSLTDGEVLHDPTGEVAQELEDLRRRQEHFLPKALSEHAIACIRHWHQHIFDKVKGRLDTMPVFCRFLLCTNIHWLLENYFRVRGHVFKGEKHAIEYWQRHEPEIYEAVTEFYATHDLERQVEMARTISERVLAGGLWRHDEVVAFGDESSEGLQERGYEAFRRLFEEESGRHQEESGTFQEQSAGNPSPEATAPVGAE